VRPLTQHVPVRFPAETIRRIKGIADAEGVTVSTWIRRAVDEKLRRQLVGGRSDSRS
jgi:predicted DNA binding CopG/RHH family protein